MGQSVESERQIPRWPVKRTRAPMASHGANSQLVLPNARLLEREGSQQAQIAAQCEILPGTVLREGTDGTDLPSSPPALRKLEEFFVPDSPEEIWSGVGKDSHRHGSCKVPRKPPSSTSFDELVVPDSPEETWGASPCELSRTPLASTNFEELVVPDSPEEPGASKSPSHHRCKLPRPASIRKFHEISVDDGNKAALGRESAELLSPVRTAKPIGKLRFKDAADSWAYDRSQCNDQFPVLPPAEMTRSTISDQPVAIDVNRDLDHKATELIHAPDEKHNPRVKDGLATSSSPSNSCGASGKPLAVSSMGMDRGLVNRTATWKDTTFSTASEISESALCFPSKKAEVFLGDRVKNNSNAGRVTLSAFSTASGGHISVTSSAMRKARQLFQDKEAENGDLSTGPETQRLSAKPGFAKGKAPLGYDDKENQAEFERTSSHLDCRQLLRSSESAPHRTKKLIRPLSEIQAGVPIRQSADIGEEFFPALNGKLGGSCSSHQRKENPKDSPSVRSRLSGIATTISDEAIQVAKVRFARPGERKENAVSEAAEKKTVNPDWKSTFQTGSGRTVAISREAIEKAKALLAHDGKATSYPGESNYVALRKIPSPAPTFRTTSGRKVAISSEAMTRAKALLAPVEALDDPVAITSFVAGNGKSVSISCKALEKARAFLGEGFQETSTVEALDNPVAITSFVTGSGKSVSISAKALVKARAFFGAEFEESGTGTSHERKLDIESHVPEEKETKFRQPMLITSKSSPEHNLHYPDTPAGLSGKPSSTAGGEYQWRNARAFKPPRTRPLGLPEKHRTKNDRKQSDDTVFSKGNLLTSIRGAETPGNQRHFLNSVSVPNGRQQLQPPSPAYLKDGRTGWMTLREYIEGIMASDPEVLSSSAEVRSMTADAADNYRILNITEGGRRESVGSTEIWKLLLDLGADGVYASKEWVANHYKWIIWKLASSERKHPRQAARKVLTLDIVLEELKYRYDTELSGRRSAIRRITERDSLASRAMVLLVSAIRHNGDLKEHTGNEASSSDTAKIEVTDGWYRLNGVLDAPLTKYLRQGKLKVGKKIQVSGATLCCCPDSTTPLEAFRDSFLTLHVNGTYRARQNHRLGFCRGSTLSLAFRCIKPDGDLVPKTYVGVTRVYPILFKETSADGFSIVRSARAEKLASNEFERRRAKAVEEAILKLENSCDPSKSEEEKDEEGYDLFDAVERAAEPDVLMADMTPEQLNAFAAFQARRETSRQATIEDAVKEALHEAGLYSRNVKRFLKVRATGLQRRGEERAQLGQRRKEGMISIWDISEEQDIVEGSVYCVAGLKPVTWGSSSNGDQLQLQSYRSTSWRHVPEATYEKHFWFPYTCRAPTQLSDIDEKSVYREFDVAAKVLVVDEPFSSGSRTNQWVFMADGSTSSNNSGDAWVETQILAVKVSLPALAFARVDPSLVGSVVGFCNLVQQPKDYEYHWWVADISDLSFFSSNFSSHPVKHLQKAANSVLEWDKSCPWAADELRNLIQAEMSQGRGLAPLSRPRVEVNSVRLPRLSEGKAFSDFANVELSSEEEVQRVLGLKLGYKGADLEFEPKSGKLRRKAKLDTEKTKANVDARWARNAELAMALRPVIRLLRLQGFPILQQLQLEECLLRTTQHNWCLLNDGTSPPAIVMGISGKPEQLLHVEKVVEDRVAVIKRFSGGGTVVVDEGTLFVTLICSRSAVPTLELYPRPIMSWTEQLYVPVFRDVPGFQLREHDYVFNNHKFGGNAQSIIKDRWLHHTSFLWDYQDSRMALLKLPQRAPVYRQARTHADFICRLGDFLPSREYFMDAVVKGLERHFEVQEDGAGRVNEQLANVPHLNSTKLIEWVELAACSPGLS